MFFVWGSKAKKILPTSERGAIEKRRGSFLGNNRVNENKLKTFYINDWGQLYYFLPVSKDSDAECFAYRLSPKDVDYFLIQFDKRMDISVLWTKEIIAQVPETDGSRVFVETALLKLTGYDPDLLIGHGTVYTDSYYGFGKIFEWWIIKSSEKLLNKRLQLDTSNCDVFWVWSSEHLIVSELRPRNLIDTHSFWEKVSKKTVGIFIASLLPWMKR